MLWARTRATGNVAWAQSGILLLRADPDRPLSFLRRDRIFCWKRIPSDGPADDRQGETPLSALENPMTQQPIPATDSISELAAFWATHDLTDYEDELEAVEGRVFERLEEGRDLLLHLDPEEAVTVREAASARGIDEAAVVREWIREHAGKAAG